MILVPILAPDGVPDKGAARVITPQGENGAGETVADLRWVTFGVRLPALPERGVQHGGRHEQTADQVEPGDDGRRRPERAIHLRRRTDLAAEVVDAHQVESLHTNRDDDGAGNERLPRRVPVR